MDWAFIICCLIAGIFFLLTIYYLVFYPSKKQKDQEEFNKNKIAIIEYLIKQHEQLKTDSKLECERSLEEFVDKVEAEKERISADLYLLQQQEIAAKNRHEELLQEWNQKSAEAINNLSKEETVKMQGVIEYYQNQKTQLQLNFDEFVEDINEKKVILQKQLEEQERKQEEIIAQYKRDEEKKKQKDFYRIVLTDVAIEDVKKLKGIAAELHDPSILYKLIYKTYYEKPFLEMVGRVIDDKTSIGIYKITNIENGRTYIGQTRQTFKERWRTHVKRGVKAEPTTQNKLYSAMWEDGIENFTFEVIATCKVDELNQKEKEYIAFYHADTWGYNGTSGNN